MMDAPEEHQDVNVSDKQPPRWSSDLEAGTLLGEVLLRCAREEGSVRALARALGLSPQTVYELVKGEREPAKHAARAISDFLGGRQRHLDEFTADRVIEWAGLSVDGSPRSGLA